jgi:hypothetical protein
VLYTTSSNWTLLQFEETVTSLEAAQQGENGVSARFDEYQGVQCVATGGVLIKMPLVRVRFQSVSLGLFAMSKVPAGYVDQMYVL